MKLVNKPRRGVALIMAMVVVLVGGAIVAVTFSLVFRYSWFSLHDREGFVDHTTVIDAIQTEKAHIIGTNIANREKNPPESVLHAQKLVTLQESWPKDPSPPPINASNDLRVYAQKTHTVNAGVGSQWYTVDVFDMFFDPTWVDYATLRTKPDEMVSFPSIFNMAGDAVGTASMTPEGEHKDSSTGTRDKGVPGDELDPNSYGAYLIQVRLYDKINKIDKLVRTTEEAFVQLIPKAP